MSSVPHPKVAASGLVGAVATLALWLATGQDVGIGAAAVFLLSTVAGYLTPGPESMLRKLAGGVLAAENIEPPPDPKPVASPKETGASGTGQS